MFGILIPPTIETGERITDPALLRELDGLRRDRPGQKAFARRIGPALGMPDADFCFVDPKPDPETGLLVAYIARYCRA